MKKFPKAFNWNIDLHEDVPFPAFLPSSPSIDQLKSIEVLSEDCRDGFQGSKKFPSAEEIINHLKLLTDLGIKKATVGVFSGKGTVVSETTKEVLKEIKKQKLFKI